VTLALPVGDPAGVGPAVSIEAVLDFADERFVLFGDALRLESLARSAGSSRFRRVDPEGAFELAAGEVGLAHVARWDDETLAARAPTAPGGRAQLSALDAATAAVLRGEARALVTGPVSKEAIALSGTSFTGQTEWLAAAAGLAADAVTMMFLGPRLRVALVTTHLAVRDAPAAIRPERVVRACLHLAEALPRLGGAGRGQLLVSGLNPHAGEGGLFGDEERTVIAPAIDRARRMEPFFSGAASLEGPVPAEAALRRAAAGEVDGVVAMMHDQATIASKLLDFGEAVNVTWGLPFVRASVDHGVAYDAAARGAADPSGMRAAIDMARRLTVPAAAGEGAGGSP